MDPQTLPTVLNVVRKIAGYKKSALALVNMARNSASVRRASTVIVSLKPTSFSRYERKTPTGLAAVLERIADNHHTGWQTDTLATLLSSKLKQNQRVFVKTLNKLEKEAKVHAEVQLVWYLRERQGPNPPRFIASSKKACYLCNALILDHSEYVCTGTHGRLYEGWWRPWGDVTPMDREFIVDLERAAIDRINQILDNKATKMENPRESTAPSTMSQRSTILTTLGEEDAEEHQGSESDDTVIPEGRRSSSSSLTEKPQGTRTAALPEAEGQVTPPSPSYPPPPPPGKVVRFESDLVVNSAVSIVPENPRKEDEPVPCGEGKQWRSIKSGDTAYLRLPGSLNLHVEYTTGPPAEGSKPLRFSVREISAEELLVSVAKMCPVYDLSSLEEAVACDAGREELILRRGGDMFRIGLDVLGT
ncbi:hypothetical protein AK830_g1879 [Neonectria ditissima]|uniref:Uncharacterized protein n=1 Tax=Neonectria ditissima TaxID=78410 RepID=A0A0P7BY64_9HYPO|nr:hypothetical protein AK830_g1879 [Neonectria ditissima]